MAAKGKKKSKKKDGTCCTVTTPSSSDLCLNLSTEFTNTVFHNNYSSFITLLSNERVNVNHVNYIGQRAIYIACHEGRDSFAAKLIACKRVDLNARDDKLGNTGLMAAAEGEKESIVARLIACNEVNLNIKNFAGGTALMKAACPGLSYSIVARIVESGRADIDVLNDFQQNAIMIAGQQGRASIVDLLAEAGAILSSPDHGQFSLYGAVYECDTSPENRASTFAVLKKHGIISDNVPPNFQSKYYFQDGEGKFYTRNLKHQRWLNRRTLFLALYRTYQWSLANQVEDDARRTLPPALSGVGKFICQCWFDVAGGGKSIDVASDTLGNGIGRLIMQFYGGFDASKSPYALRGQLEYGKVPDNAHRCGNCLEKKESKSFFNCSSCGRVRYCGRQCQKDDWKRHKESCKIWAEEKKKKKGGEGKKKN
jgi:hypothetical protein